MAPGAAPGASPLSVDRQPGTGTPQARSPSELYVNASANAARFDTTKSG